jgi:uncharacterized protein YkwD
MRTSTTTSGHRRALAFAAVACAGLATATTIAPAAASGRHHAKHAVAVRSYDHTLLSKSNHARATKSRHHVTMNDGLWKIADHYAKHLSHTDLLVHNPNLGRAVTKACPDWTTYGENIGEAPGSNPSDMFSAYMHSPEHKANILDKHYREIGSATVAITVNGVTTQWNVTDFANGCN